MATAPKSRRGGKRNTANTTSAGATSNQQNVAPQPQQTPDLDDSDVRAGQIQGGATSYAQFQSMSDDDKADVIEQALTEGVPRFLDDSALQRLVFSLGANNKPQIVDDATLDNTKGRDLYRTVKSVYDSNTDVGYSAKEIIQQLHDGDFTMFSSSGGSAYGRGLYFAESISDSSWYGTNTAKNNAMTRAKINPNANIVSYNQIRADYQKEMNSGSKLGRAIRKADRDGISGMGVYALAKGIAGWRDNGGYNVIIDRGALMVSKKIKTNFNRGVTQW